MPGAGVPDRPFLGIELGIRERRRGSRWKLVDEDVEPLEHLARRRPGCDERDESAGYRDTGCPQAKGQDHEQRERKVEERKPSELEDRRGGPDREAGEQHPLCKPSRR
jgi:hypothetical protein